MINQSQEDIFSNAINETVLSESKSVEQQKRRLLNLVGVLNGPQFMLIALLIIVSVSSVWLQTSEIRIHERYLRMYFNQDILGLAYQGLYEDGDNIDQSQNQIVTYDDMCTLLKDLTNVTIDYHEDGIVWFEIAAEEKELISMEFQYFNNTFDTLVFETAEQTFAYFEGFETNFTRDFLLKIKQMKLISKLGSNKFVNDYQIEATFTMHQHLIIEVSFEYTFDDAKSHIGNKLRCLRVLQQLVAAVLLINFIYRLFLFKNMSLRRRQKQSNYKKWYLFMSLMNVIILLNQVYAPMAAWLQLLPLFQSPQQEQIHQHQSYNLNRNVRYSAGLIITIWVPLILCLNGFIFYSMLIYANSDEGYFSTYFRAFCDYFYNMFQCGTYELFDQMQIYGTLAEILYVFLYFYVFMVGTTLIPAFFCTLMQMKINQIEIKNHTTDLVAKAICPNCTSRHSYKVDQHALNIVVSSPRLTPLVKQKKLSLSPSKAAKSIQSSKQIVLQIQNNNEQKVPLKDTYKFSIQLVSYSRKMQSLFRRLNSCVSNELEITELTRIQALLLRYQEELI